MTWNNVYLGTPTPVGNYQGSTASTYFSDITVGNVLANTATIATGTITTGTITTVNAATITATSKISFIGSGATLQGGIYSGATSGAGSTTSLTVSDGEFSVVSLSATSCLFVYRSGNTVYKFSPIEAEGLSTTP